jgi:ribonuclease-3
MRANMRCLGTAMMCDMPAVDDGVAMNLGKWLGGALVRTSEDLRAPGNFFELTATPPPHINNAFLPSMSSQKRGGAFHHYGDRDQQFNKRPRPTFNSAAFDDQNRGQQGKPQQRGNAIPQRRTEAPPAQVELSAADMQTGLAALLDRFVDAEMSPGADKSMLHHARELRRLLSERTAHSKPDQAKRDLDEKRPIKTAHVVIPDYIYRGVVASKDLPPLPPITEPTLREAVFTHQSVHATHMNVHQHIDLGVDYERLEFLGDAYIELIASRALYNRFPLVDVPQLCSWRERLVENVALAKFSEAYGFPAQLKRKIDFDPESKAWKKVVADIFEAYVAGVVLSNPADGFAIAETWLDKLWATQLLGFKEKIVENPRARDDLQKMLVLNGIDVKYREERPMIMERGVQKYFIGVYLTGWGYTDEWLGSGEGQKKAQASIAAATDALKRNSAILQDAANQKKALMEARTKEREEREAAEAANGAANGDGSGSPAPKATETQDAETESVKKRKTEDDASEKKSKKHKKDKKEKEKDK